MKEYTFECDRCGKTTTRSSVPHVTITEECSKDYFNSVLFDYDLCVDCLQELKRFMHAFDNQREAVPA